MAAGGGATSGLGAAGWVGVAASGGGVADVIGLATVVAGLALVADSPPSANIVVALTSKSATATVAFDRRLRWTLTIRSWPAVATGSDSLRIDAA
jgi:hypothetical protein